MHLRIACATWLLPLLLLTPPAASQAQFTFVTNNGTITITGYPGPGGDVVIPDRLPDTANGLPVTTIGGYAFYFSSFNITSVIIPGSVISIGSHAFESRKGLGTVIIPNSVIIIGDHAFASCNNLTNAIIPSGVIVIGDHAFDYCHRLDNVNIPDSVISVGEYAFQCGLTNLTIGRGLTSIEDYTFAGHLTNVTIPNNITSIGDGAFVNCSILRGVYFEGNAPNVGLSGVFRSPIPTVYYLPGTTGWGSTFSSCPTVLWNPQAQAAGVRTNRFGFNITGTASIPIVVEASTNPGSASWTALQTCTLTNGLIYFSDPMWTNYPGRFYRIRSP